MLYLFNSAAILKTFTFVVDEKRPLKIKKINLSQITQPNDKIGKFPFIPVLIFVFSCFQFEVP